MAFTIFSSGTTAYANEVNDNFYHIADGDRLPRGGVSMTDTDSAYDIGSSSTTWSNLYADNVYCTNINISGDVTSDSIPHLISEYGINSINTATTDVEFTGLDGDTDVNYHIIVNYKAASSQYIRIVLNNDSSTSYTARSNVNYNTFSSYYMFLQTQSAANIYLYAKSGYVSRPFLSESLGFSDNSVGAVTLKGGAWHNSDDNITSIKFIVGTDFLTGTSIQLWRWPS